MMGCIACAATSRRRGTATLCALVPLQVALAIGVDTTTPTSVTLSWTAVGDDGHEGTAACYDLRCAAWEITEANWDAAARLEGEPAPQPAGSAETFTAEELLPATTYFFALKVADEVPNWSALSNVVCATTPALPETTALACCDIPVAGTQLGDYTLTHDCDGLHEEIEEVPFGSRQRNQTSLLEHRWEFHVPGGIGLIFQLQAHRPDNPDGDDFAFEVSIDGAAFLPLVTVASPVPQTYLATLPAAASGAVCVRVVDTDRVPGEGSLDRICIDCMGLTPSAGGVIHIDDLLVTHRVAGNTQVGVCTAWVRDQAGDPVSGATVHADYAGPIHGSACGVTGSDGRAVIASPKVGPVCEEWCFEVTGVTHATCPYDPGANVVTSACESGWFLPGPSSPLAELRFGLGGEEGVRRSGRGALHFTLPEPAHVELLVFSVNGRRAATLVDGWCAAGRHAVDLAAARLPSGVHFVRLEADGRRATRRVVWVR